MIYVASLGIPAKKALAEKCFQTSIVRIIEQLPLSQEVSNMDAVILGPRDVYGANSKKMQTAIDNCNPGVCIIYLFSKENERDLLQCENKKQVKRIKDSVILEAHEEFLSNRVIKETKQQILYNDMQEMDNTGFEGMPKIGETQLLLNEPESKVVPELTVSNIVEEETVVLETLPEDAKLHKLNEGLDDIKDYKDWNLFLEQLNQDSVTRKLVEENSEYIGLLDMLDSLEKQIENIWVNPSFTSEYKFNKIKEIGLKRSGLKGRINSINVEKVLHIIEIIGLSAKQTVEERLEQIDLAVTQIGKNQSAVLDSSHIDQIITERTSIQVELLEIIRSVINLYRSMDLFVTDTIQELDDKLPTDSERINDMVKSSGTAIFTPVNTADLVTKLMESLQSNRITVTQIEASVKKVISLIFQICEKDNEIIEYQQNMISLLKTNRVEEVIIKDSLLKNSMNLYIGSDETGRTATALTWSGILSRRQNTLLLDITGRSKLSQYGVKTYKLNEFMEQRVEEQFICVESEKLTSTDIVELVKELKNRLNYYPHINVIVAPEDSNILNQLSEEALAVYYITNCSNRSINEMKRVVEENKDKNIAKKVVMIDVPSNPLMIGELMQIDPASSKIITLPNLNIMKSCSISSGKPYEYDEIIRVFEDAFR